MRTLILPVVLLSLSACVQDVGKGHVKAEVVEPAPEKAEATPEVVPEATPAAPEVKLAIDTAKSSIRALGAKVTQTHPIDFLTIDGSISTQGEAVTAVAFSADIASLKADHPDLTVHLKKKDFLWASEYPQAIFQSTSIAEGHEDQAWSHTVTGDLTVRGVKKTINIPAKLTVSTDSVDARSEFVIDRQWFGVTYPGRADDLVQDNVRMTVQVHAPRK